MRLIQRSARLFAICLSFLSAALIVSPAAAMRVSPMVVEMESQGSDAVARIEVQNTGPDTLPFETRIFRMEIDEDGKMTETPADDQFLVFPPQGALPPGGKQVLRLQGVGDPAPATSEAYYISVEQLPVALAPGSDDAVAAKVQVLYNMRALAVVAPPGAKPEGSATSVRPIVYQPRPAEGQSEAPAPIEGVEVILTNQGRRHAMMSNFGWKMEGKDKSGQWLRVDVSPEELTTAVGTGYVPALGSRKFYLPISGFGPEPIKLTFQQ